MRTNLVILVILSFLITACGMAKVSKVSGQNPGHQVNTIAMAPNGGIMADAIAIELSDRGFQVFGRSQISNLLIRLDMKEVEAMTPQNLQRLRDEGIDAYLSARSISMSDGTPENASVRVNSAHTGAILAGISWQNGWGGQPGSMPDRTMRSNLREAASDIAEELDAHLKGVGDK